MMKVWGKRIENGRERAYGAATAAEGNVVKEMTVRHGGEKERTMLRDTLCLCPCDTESRYIYTSSENDKIVRKKYGAITPLN